LDACFGLLATYYEERAQLARNVLRDMAYPMFVLHMAVLLFPISLFTGLLLQGRVFPYVWQKLTILGPFYGAAFFLLYVCQGKRGESWRAFVEQVLRWVPLVGAARRYLALARLSAALEALISSGVTIVEAWELAAAVSGSPALRQTMAPAKKRMLDGETPGEVIGSISIFPETFASLYRSGELSGKLDQTLRHLHQRYQEEGTRKLRAAAEWGPRLAYLGIAAYIGFVVIRFWVGYFEGMMNAF